MTESLKLTESLIQEIIGKLTQHDAQCSDELVASQYLSAIVGYVIGRQRIDTSQKEQVLDEMVQFIHHVYTDTVQQQQSQSQSQAPTSKPMPAENPEQAFGIWKPGK